MDGRRYADPFFNRDDCADETCARLGKVLPRSGGSMHYVYDMGDWWEPRTSVEKIFESDSVAAPTCTGGKGDSPVEDWSREWYEEPTTPFDMDAINRAFARLEYRRSLGACVRTTTVARWSIRCRDSAEHG
jgi:hypothetical protein